MAISPTIAMVAGSNNWQPGYDYESLYNTFGNEIRPINHDELNWWT